MQMYECRPKMLVTADFNEGRREVVRIENPKIKKVTVLRADGKRWDFYPASLQPAPEGAEFNLRVAEAKSLGFGTVVKFTDGSNPGPYTVIGIQAGGTYKVARLFGSQGNRYFHNVGATTIEVMDAAALKAYLAYMG